MKLLPYYGYLNVLYRFITSLFVHRVKVDKYSLKYLVATVGDKQTMAK